jgi:hypothetical protein
LESEEQESKGAFSFGGAFRITDDYGKFTINPANSRAIFCYMENRRDG